jgi:hypothetical protein
MSLQQPLNQLNESTGLSLSRCLFGDLLRDLQRAVGVGRGRVVVGWPWQSGLWGSMEGGCSRFSRFASKFPFRGVASLLSGLWLVLIGAIDGRVTGPSLRDEEARPPQPPNMSGFTVHKLQAPSVCVSVCVSVCATTKQQLPEEVS